MILSTKDLYSALEQQYYVNVPFPLGQNVIEEAVQAFFTFLNEPEDVKSHINFSIAPMHRRGDIGYTHRDPADHIYNDSKDFFHFHPALFQKYAEFLDSHPVVKDLADKAKPIWDLIFHTVQDLLQALEPEFPGIVDKVFGTDEDVHIMLRFLKYNWASSEKYLAKPHFDAGSFTLAIAVSTPGLRIGSGPDNLKLIDHHPDNAIFMLSSNFQNVLETEKLSPGWHDVIQLDETQIGKPYARWAVVAFIEAHHVEALPRSETHKFYRADAA